jgi:hypothetical protein
MKARAVPTTDKGWQTYLESLQAPSERRWIAMGGGLALCFDTSGAKTFQARLRDSKGASQRIRIGTFPATSVSAARRHLLDIKSAVNRSPDTKVRKRLRALGRVLWSDSVRRDDWRNSKPLTRALAQIRTQVDVDDERAHAPGILAGRLGQLVCEVVNDPCVSDQTLQGVGIAATKLIDSFLFAWAAVDKRKQALRPAAVNAAKGRSLADMVDQCIAKKGCSGWASRQIEAAIFDDVNALRVRAGKEKLKPDSIRSNIDRRRNKASD